MSRRFAPASLALLLALALVGCEGNKRHADTPLPTAQTAGGASFAQRTPHVIPALAPTATPRGSAAPPSQASSPSPTSAGGAWRAVGQMIVPREGHTATLLPSGKVLIAGGRSRHSLYLAAAELYDPATETFVATGSMAVGREEHAATLLPDGRVLVTGGTTPDTLIHGGATDNSKMARAELYDPDSGTWSPAAAMHVRRTAHTAILLPDGQVLVAGGSTGGGFADPLPARLNQAEVYDPASDTWTLTGPMRIPDRRGSGAVLLPDGGVLLVGGGAGIDDLASVVERYDAATNAWTSANQTRMFYHGPLALLANGKALAVGGFRDRSARLSPPDVDAEVYDPATDRWSPAGAMPLSCKETVTPLRDGTALVICGKTAEVYDPAANRWAPVAGLTSARGKHTATLLPGGAVLVVGGKNNCNSCEPIDYAEVYTPSARLRVGRPTATRRENRGRG